LTCTACQQPTATGIHLCDTCTDNLYDILNTLPELLADLDITTAKLDATSAPGGSPGFTSTPPGKLSALDTSYHLRSIVNSWTSMLTDYDTRKPAPPLDGDPIAHLRRATNEIRKHDWSGTMLDELHRATSKAHRLIDRPRDIRILGTCERSFEHEGVTITLECGGEIKADYDDAYAQCCQCGALYLVQDLVAERERKARGELMTGPQARRWLAENANVQVSYDDIRNWMKRKMLPYVLERVTTTNRSVKLVYPGDVLKVHQLMHDKRIYATTWHS